MSPQQFRIQEKIKTFSVCQKIIFPWDSEPSLMKLMMTTFRGNYTAAVVLSIQIEITYIIKMFIVPRSMGSFLASKYLILKTI